MSERPTSRFNYSEQIERWRTDWSSTPTHVSRRGPSSRVNMQSDR